MPYDRSLLRLVTIWVGVGFWALNCPTPAQSQSPADVDVAVYPGNVLLVTIDGLRWQEVFRGADNRLISSDAGAKNIPETQKRFLAADAIQRRRKLMPFFWSTVADQGVIYGDLGDNSLAVVTNSQHFSYPGYSEILCGLADPRIDSNDKTYNENVTVLEWLHEKPEFAGRVAAFCSWDVFPFIINDKRSGIPVNAGWQPVSQTLADSADLRHQVDQPHHSEMQRLDALAAEIPHQWESVRYDYFTFKAADIFLRARQPRVMYVSLGETDDWAHEGRYDLYLDAAQRNDDYLRRLWETIQAIPQYHNNTTLIIASDHGRGDTREEWKSHNRSIPGCEAIWIAVMGPKIEPNKPLNTRVTQSQVAATVASVLGYHFANSKPGIAAALPCVNPIK